MSEEFDDLAEMYRPRGACARCDHLAQVIWFNRIGSQRFEFRCMCCMAEGRLKRALEYQKRIPQLEKELADAKAGCGIVRA